MRLCLFEDGAERLEPLSLTRPVFELHCGMTTLGQKQLRAFGPAEWGVLVRPALEDVYRGQRFHVAVNDGAWLRGDDLLLVNGRWTPPRGWLKIPVSSCLGRAGDGVAFVFLKKSDVPAIGFEQLPELLDHWQTVLDERPAAGRLIAYPWDLVELNAAEIHRDYECIAPRAEVAAPATLTVLGPRTQLWVAPSAKVEPMVVADTTHGPVVIDEDAVLSAFTRLEGPCYIGPGSQVFGAKIRAGTSLGPQCRVGGEIEASILHGYSNKYHDGFLGHSYVGEWVNLGAGTHNSDLRNDYGEVTVTLRGLPVRTGVNKVGCFLGDHTKTGLGTLLNTGTNVGAFCNLLPAGKFAPKYVPSFTSWWNGSLTEAFTLDQLLTTAEIAMQRRGVTLTDAHRTLYSRLMDETAAERRRVMRESEQRLLRRSA
jgi:UDP-N-acetylglucosamine diphosphorylase / glucose-1-phosphate thymidylyltransferase / UDP-N-acetylgalactosamine diphosphorylase / glucosamine-1-phosphate N-acetyltransferase / galactosamine-1-phosphate N-acetyltransferase